MARRRTTGCAIISLIVCVLGFTAAQTELGSYVIATTGMFFAVMLSPLISSSQWHVTNADVIGTSIRTHEVLGQYGSVTLSYFDDDGGRHQQAARVSSSSGRLTGLSAGESILIKVCRHDPTIITSAQMAIHDDRDCASVRSGKPEAVR
jgi:hypothetical protein